MKTHSGNCHCGKVAYEVTTDIEKAMECNCSYCARNGLLLTFVPKEQFTLKTGEENLTEYRFNTKRIAHLFCKTCGIQCFGMAKNPEGKEMVAVNIRSIPDIDLETIKIEKFNGKDF